MRVCSLQFDIFYDSLCGQHPETLFTQDLASVVNFLRARFSFEVFLRLLLINFVSFFLSFSKRIVCAVKWVTFY